MDQTVPITLGPVSKLLLKDQDSPPLLGDLLDLVAQLVVQGLQRLLDAGRVQRQSRHRAEGSQESHLLVLEWHSASLGSQDQQARELAAAPHGAGRFTPQGDHGVGRGIGARTRRQRMGEPRRRGLLEPNYQGIVHGQGLLVGRGPVTDHKVKRLFRGLAEIQRSPLDPQDLRRPFQQPFAQRDPVDQTADRHSHLLHGLVELVLLAKELAVDHPLESPSSHLRKNENDDHREGGHHRPPRGRIGFGREQAIADQPAAGQEHGRVGQTGGHAEREVNHTAVDDLFDLHQLVPGNAEGVGDRVE